MSQRNILTYRFRVKDKHAALLQRHAKAVNTVWNFCNDTQKSAVKWGKRWPSGFDLINLTAGSSKILQVSATTICEVCRNYESSRRAKRKQHLRYRGRKNLGWVPFGGRDIRLAGDKFRFYGTEFSVWKSREIPSNGKIVAGGSFSQDSNGCWYVNIPVEIPVRMEPKSGEIGIDLGLQEFVTLSTGAKVDAPRLFRKSEIALGKAQRANKKKRTKAIHVKIANQRRDFLHKLSTKLANQYGRIVVGNVCAKALARTTFAKSVLDAGWSQFRYMLEYKAIAHSGVYKEVNEAHTSTTCSACGSRSGPKGRKGLCIREWKCCDCGAVHDRDHNAAILILRRGHATPLVGAA